MNNREQACWRSLPFRLSHLFIMVGSMIIALSVFFSTPAWATDTQTGAQLFEIHCVGCHPQGGNIIRRGKTLKQAALKKNQVDTLEAIATLVTNGKNNMPAFQERLSPAEITDVSAYVLEQAAQGWR